MYVVAEGWRCMGWDSNYKLKLLVENEPDEETGV